MNPSLNDAQCLNEHCMCKVQELPSIHCDENKEDIVFMLSLLLNRAGLFKPAMLALPANSWIAPSKNTIMCKSFFQREKLAITQYHLA